MAEWTGNYLDKYQIISTKRPQMAPKAKKLSGD